MDNHKSPTVFNWKKIILRSDHRPLDFTFNPRKELPKVTTSRILRWAIRLMAFDFEIENVNGNSIPHIDALSRLRFYKESKDKTEEEFKDTFLHWVETAVLSLDRMAAETRHDPILSRRIRKKHMGKLFQNGKTQQRNKMQAKDITWSDL